MNDRMNDRNHEELSYLQYRVSFPEVAYSKVMSPDTWPKGVKIRDFIFNRRNVAVSMDNFLVRNAAHNTTHHLETIGPADEPISE